MDMQVEKKKKLLTNNCSPSHSQMNLCQWIIACLELNFDWGVQSTLRFYFLYYKACTKGLSSRSHE